MSISPAPNGEHFRRLRPVRTIRLVARPVVVSCEPRVLVWWSFDPTVWSLPISCAFGASYSTMRVQPMDPFLGLHRRPASDASSSQHPPSPLQRRKNPRGSVEWQEGEQKGPLSKRESKEMRENGSRKKGKELLADQAHLGLEN